MISLRCVSKRLCAVSGLLVLFIVAAPAAQTRDAPVRYTAMAVNMGSPARWTTLTVEMVVERCSTDAERDRLLSVLWEEGPDKLLKALQDMPRVGYIRTPDSIGYDLRFARRQPGEDGGERVVLATDRYITFWEAANRPRTIDYPFQQLSSRDRDRSGTRRT